MPASKKLVYFVDCISPYSYFAGRSLKQLSQKHQLTIEVKPILLAGLLNYHGQKGPAEIPAKREFIFLDCVRLGILNQIPFHTPPAHPFNPLLALRSMTAVEDSKQRFDFALALFEACWSRGEDLTKEETIVKVANSLHLSGEKILQASKSDAIKQQLKETTEFAIQEGVFGVPTIKIGKELFWGSDRISHVEAYLQGHLQVDHEAVKHMLDIPRGSDRKIHKNK